MIFIRPLVPGLLFLLQQGVVFAQSTSASPFPNLLPTSESPRQGLITYTVVKGDSVLDVHTNDPNEEIHVIIKF